MPKKTQTSTTEVYGSGAIAVRTYEGGAINVFYPNGRLAVNVSKMQVGKTIATFTNVHANDAKSTMLVFPIYLFFKKVRIFPVLFYYSMIYPTIYHLFLFRGLFCRYNVVMLCDVVIFTT